MDGDSETQELASEVIGTTGTWDRRGRERVANSEVASFQSCLAVAESGQR